jgi:glycosyltransferase involved in cell wall biosynthesis
VKIVHLSQTDGGAGAGRAAYRIHRSLLSLGVKSILLVSDKRTDDTTVFCASDGWARRLQRKICEYLETKLARASARSSSVFISPSRFSYFSPASDPRVQAADIVSLYWINGAFIPPEGLAGITQPIVWRLSDVWPFTGCCHYPGECTRFEQQCGNCPQLRTPSGHDASYRLWKRKEAAWKGLNITVAAPSQWVASLARRSALFSGRRVEVIPTGVDIDRFRPMNKQEARARLGLPADKIVLVFGAMSSTSDARKGFKELCSVLKTLASSPLSERILAVVFGNFLPLPVLPVSAISLGEIHDDERLAAAYSCADMVIVPSLEDNLPNVALEAIACGAPVAGFAVGGMPDIVRQGWNGVLAPTGDTSGLAKAMADALSKPETLAVMSAQSREHALKYFSSRTQAESYLKLYEELIENAKNRRTQNAL